jgi:lipopolysaccharide exporter
MFIEKRTDVPTRGFSQYLKEFVCSVFAGNGLRASVFRGGMWLGTGSFAEQVTRFGRNIILTRLLAPEAFGLMAIVLSASSVIHTLMDIGVKEALIQNPRGSEEEYVGAAWWMAFGRAVSFWAIVSAIAPLIAKFYGNSELGALFRIAAIAVLFEGAMSSRAYAAIREMKFRQWAIINHGGAILGVLLTLGLGLLIRGVWALVLGYVAESVGRFALSYIIWPYLPPQKIPVCAARDLWRFSRKAFGLSLLNLIFARTDVFVLAKMFSAADLGLYTMAVYLVQAPATFVMNVLGQTLLPALSRVQSDRAKVVRILLSVTSAIGLIGMPTLVLVTFCGRLLLTLGYGPRYANMGTPLVLASVVALVNLLNGQITSVFFAKGLPQLHRRCVVLMATAMIIFIYPMIKIFGISGGQIAALIAVLVGFSFQIIRVRSLIDSGAFYASGISWRSA